MTEQEERLMVDLPAALVKRAVLMAHEEGRDCAGDAQLVADEVIRLRNEGHLSRNFACHIGAFIYQRGMQQSHFGDVRLPRPVAALRDAMSWKIAETLPEEQVDPVRVKARFAEVARFNYPSTQEEQDFRLSFE